MTANSLHASCSSLIKESSLPLGALPYHEVRTSDFKDALERAFALSYARLKTVRSDAAEPDFENTIEAIEDIDAPLEQAWLIFDNYGGLQASDELDALSQHFAPQRQRLANAILMDKALFERVSRVHGRRAELSLTVEQNALLTRTYEGFIRNGAKLTEAQKKRVNQIDERTATLSERFQSNVRASVNSYQLIVRDRSKLEGLPENALGAAEQLGREKKLDGAWVFSLHAPSVVPLLTFAKDRSLREEIWRAANSKAGAGEFNNKPLLLEIAKLKAERARILGYDSHAAYTVEDRMAKSVRNVEMFLKRLVAAYRPAAERDLHELERFAGHEIKPWDVAFYSEKLREKLYSYNEEELRPYFPLKQVIEGAMRVASLNYGIVFVERPDLPKWDPSVQVYEVQDPQAAGEEKSIALFYLDPFPRESKRQGAWMSNLQRAGMRDGKWYIPHVLNAGNFTPPVDAPEGRVPALLSLDEVYTVFHELGHGLHGMLTKARYRSLSGAETAWDAVELPSQMNENFVTRPEVLDIYAKHYKTGERIPPKLIDQVRRAQNFQAGLQGLRQVSLAMLDLAWFSKDLSQVATDEDVAAWEKAAMDPYRVVPVPEGALISPSFSHIFGGGYSAGYYSYKWADVLAADAFSLFEKHGVFDPEIAGKFRREFLERGRTEEPDVLYRRFRGGDADPDALLRKEGLVK